MADEILSREEVLRLLSTKAREGSVSALVALERALRLGHDPAEESNELDRILAGDFGEDE